MNRPGRAIARTVRAILLGTALAAVPTISYALGLGALKVKSALNEPLNAEIDFTSISKKELSKLTVALAPRQDFNAAGVDRAPYLGDVKFALSKRLNGQPFVQLTSEQPIREPFLHFLVQVEWAGGRLVREFTALIDPPTLFAGAAPSVQVPDQAPLPEPVQEPMPMMAALPPGGTVPATPEPAAPLPESSSGSLDVPTLPPPAASEPSTTMAAAHPAGAERGHAAADAPMTTSSEDPLGPPRLGDPNVAISAETGWPIATTGPVELAAAADAQAAEPIVPTPLASVAPVMAPSAPTSMAAPMPAPMPVAGGDWANTTRYQVKRGDTLWGIAQQIRVDPTLSLEQVIMALYEANRDAFFGNNVNNVWAGEVLLIPERLEVENLSTGRARQVFLAQYNEWQEYKLKLASASRTFKVAAGPEQGTVPQESGGGTPATRAQPEPTAKQAEASTAPADEPKPEPAKKTEQASKPAKPEKTGPKPVETPPAEAATPPKAAEAPVVAARPKPPADLLKIVRAAIDSEAGAKGKVAEAEAADTSQKERLALAERATTLDEAMQSKQLEQKEMQERVGTHQSQIEKQERLIELSNKDAVKAKEALAPPEPQAAVPAEAAEKGSEGAVDKAPAQPKAQAAEKAAPSPKAKPAPAVGKAAGPAKKRRIAPPPAPAEEKSILAQVEEMFGSYVMQAVAAVVALAGGLILLTYLRRRRAAEAEFEESILTDTDAMTEGATTDSGGAQTSSSAASTSFLSDFSQGGMGNISTDEVDPLAETEVYLAYGRDEQAEEILKDAVAKDPTRHELKVKLLEIYAHRKDVAAFETLAEELYAAQEGRGGDLWNRVAEMGKKLNPGNPMFQTVAPPDEPSLPMSIPSSPAAREPAASMAGDVLDFEPPTDRGGDMQTPSFDVDTEDLKEASSGLDFDLDLEGTGAEAKSLGAGPVLPDTAELSAEELQAAASGEEDSVGLGGGPAENVLDFDMGTEDRSGGEREITAGEPGEPSWDVGAGEGTDLALETDAGLSVGTDDAQQWDETATKLDLAKAYVDMGDAEGARSILDEVLAEGNDEQKRQAAELAAQIA